MNINSIIQGNAVSTSQESYDININKVPNDNISINTKQNTKQKTKEYSKKELDKSLKEIDGFLKHDGAHAEYAVHKDFGTIMIRVVDDKTKQVLFETPPEKILDMIASICKNNGLIDKKV